MNVLLDGPPKELLVGGAPCPIDADYRNCLTIMLGFEDARLSAYEKQVLMVRLLYESEPPDFAEAAEKAVWFLNLGDEGLKTAGKKPIYSFSQDAKMIRAGFCAKGINLDKAAFMHWWDFVYAFFELRETQINEVMGVRARINSGKASKADKEFARENPQIVNLAPRAAAAHDGGFIARYEKAKAARGVKNT